MLYLIKEDISEVVNTRNNFLPSLLKVNSSTVMSLPPKTQRIFSYVQPLQRMICLQIPPKPIHQIRHNSQQKLSPKAYQLRVIGKATLLARLIIISRCSFFFLLFFLFLLIIRVFFTLRVLTFFITWVFPPATCSRTRPPNLASLWDIPFQRENTKEAHRVSS